MGESTGSRYGIVANLTEKKLQLMDEQTLLDNELQAAQQDYDTANANAKADKEFIDNEAKKRKDAVDRQVREKKNMVDILKSNKDRKSKSTADKIAAVDKALKNIQDISKDATPQ